MKYWYFTAVFYCPICGSEARYKERRYTKKPKDYLNREEWINQWDGCNAL